MGNNNAVKTLLYIWLPIWRRCSCHTHDDGGWASRLWYKHPLLGRVVLHFGEAGARDAWRSAGG